MLPAEAGFSRQHLPTSRECSHFGECFAFSASLKRRTVKRRKRRAPVAISLITLEKAPHSLFALSKRWQGAAWREKSANGPIDGAS
jgi:hypothetical protein